MGGRVGRRVGGWVGTNLDDLYLLVHELSFGGYFELGCGKRR